MEVIRMLRRECMDCSYAIEHQVDTRDTKDLIAVARYLSILAGSHEGFRQEGKQHRVGRPEFRDVLKVE